MPSATRGFTLIELAIVLVVIAFIVGGVVVGRDVIRVSQLQSILTDESRFVKATQAFRDKYHELPGDMPTATSFWGAQDGGTGTTEACHNMAITSSTVTTCNGNGDGFILPFTEADSTITTAEIRRFWQHLANAGLLETCCANDAVFEDSPHSKVSGAGWGIRADLCASNSDTTMFCMNGTAPNMYYHHHYFTYGAYSSAWTPIQPVLTPAEAFALDSKVDDGLPGTGKILNFPNGNTTYGNQNCTTTASAATSAYAMGLTVVACGLLFDSGF